VTVGVPVSAGTPAAVFVPLTWCTGELRVPETGSLSLCHCVPMSLCHCAGRGCERGGGGEKKDRVTDALNATKAAVEEGIVPGERSVLCSVCTLLWYFVVLWCGTLVPRLLWRGANRAG